VLSQLPEPEGACELQKFLSASNCMRCSVPEYAKQIQPLQELLNQIQSNFLRIACIGFVESIPCEKEVVHSRQMHCNIDTSFFKLLKCM